MAMSTGYRYSNVLRIKTYIDRLSEYRNSTDRKSHIFPIRASQFTVPALHFPLTPATVNHHRQTPQDDMGEFMMTGLRLTREGVSAETFRERFGQEMEAVFGRGDRRPDSAGAARVADSPLPRERGGVSVRLTRRGRLLGNQVFMRFVE